ncbi:MULTISPECIES: helix-turn-helix domain-containing protein [Nocardia]|uniref:hypothetical protein n=1 Tax=Nocardia TaxID=1817 RepID=UPI0013005E77|nr:MULTISPECIES: hypothetical protein [Nocardia]
MSWQAREWVDTYIPPELGVKLAARAVLGVYADYADEHGRGSYPSHLTVAWRLSCTERNVVDHVKALVEKGALIVSTDQSAVAKYPADNRPVVYDIPIHLVRADTLEEARDKKRQLLQERRDRRKQKIDEPATAEPVARSEESFRHSDKGPKNPSTTVRSSLPPRSEENFHHGPKKTSDKQAFKPPTKTTLETHTAREVETVTADAIETVCIRLHAGMERNWTNLPPRRRGDRPEITDGWRAAIRWLIKGGESIDVIEKVAVYSQDGWWLDKCADIDGFVKHFSTMAGQVERDARVASLPASPTSLAKKDATVLEWASLMDHPENAAALIANTPRAAIESPRHNLDPILEITAHETHWSEAA